MLALDEYLNQALSGEAGEVGAGGGGADAGDDGEFGAGAGVAVHEGVEDAGAGGLADGGGEAGDGEIDIYSSMVDEVWMLNKGHTPSYEPARGYWSHGGACCRLREGSCYENHLLYSLRDRSVSEGRVSEVRGELGTHYSASGRPFDRIFSAARGHELCGVGIDFVREPGGV